MPQTVEQPRPKARLVAALEDRLEEINTALERAERRAIITGQKPRIDDLIEEQLEIEVQLVSARADAEYEAGAADRHVQWLKDDASLYAEAKPAFDRIKAHVAELLNEFEAVERLAVEVRVTSLDGTMCWKNGSKFTGPYVGVLNGIRFRHELKEFAKLVRECEPK